MRENAAAEVRMQESGLAAAKAVLEAKVRINVVYLLIESGTSGYDLKLCGFKRGYYRFRIIVVMRGRSSRIHGGCICFHLIQ